MTAEPIDTRFKKCELLLHLSKKKKKKIKLICPQLMKLHVSRRSLYHLLRRGLID